MITTGQRELVLYGTVGCHLCELAEQQLLPWVTAGWQIELVDIADDDQLLARYALSIPVLRHPVAAAELAWPFDTAAIHFFLESAGVKA